MKKIYFLFLFLISLSTFSQKDYSRYYNSWRLGLNLGGAWQTADYRSCWGMAGGITLEKGFHENATNIFSFAIRGRYLGANTYGMDYSRNYDVKSNSAYNGKYDPKVNFVDSVSLSKQYVYDNYKMKLGEGSLELQITFNRLRERTHVLLNLWGGVGITSYRTKSDLLDGAGKMYDFSMVDSTGNKTKALNSYIGLIDKNYESYAYGSKNGNLVTFSPSLGFGLGYQFSPVFSMLWEYKLTLPQGTNADLLDGKLAANNDFFGSNDYYHYTGLNLVFTLRGKKKTHTKTEPITTNTVASTQPIAVPTNSVATPPTNTVVANTPPSSATPKPIITYITPPVNGHVVTLAQYKISAQVLNVIAANQIQFKFNGMPSSNYSFNAQTHILEYQATLNNGANTIQIIATNKAGQDNKTTTVEFNQPKAVGNLPIVSYINPVQAGVTVSAQKFAVKAQVLNVTAQNQISVYFNGTPTPFTYNATTKQIVFTANLNVGSNAVSITANNGVGEDSKSTTIICRETKVAGNPPVVNLINPATQINTTDNQSYNFKLGVLNVATKSDIQVIFNGVSQSNFTYDINTKELAFVTSLVVGNNTLNVNGTNQFGSDNKQIAIEFTPRIKLKAPPVISFIAPANGSGSSASNNYNYVATISNVENVSTVKAKFNGLTITNFTFDGFNFSYSAILNTGANNLEISATNSDGSNSQTAIVTYKPKVPKPPVVTILHPAGAAVANTIPYNFSFMVLNATKNQIQVFVNGVQVTQFAFINSIGSFTGNLATDLNTILVKVTNQDGTDSKTGTVFLRDQITPTDTSKNAGTGSPSQDNSRPEIMCHTAAGASPKTIEVPLAMVAMHLAHGDTKGACPVKANPIIVNPVNTNTINSGRGDGNRAVGTNTINSGRGDGNRAVEAIKDTTKAKPITTPRQPR